MPINPHCLEDYNKLFLYASLAAGIHCEKPPIKTFVNHGRFHVVLKQKAIEISEKLLRHVKNRLCDVTKQRAFSKNKLLKNLASFCEIITVISAERNGIYS